jgi:hypothetical protein
MKITVKLLNQPTLDLLVSAQLSEPTGGSDSNVGIAFGTTRKILTEDHTKTPFLRPFSIQTCDQRIGSPRVSNLRMR